MACCCFLLVLILINTFVLTRVCRMTMLDFIRLKASVCERVTLLLIPCNLALSILMGSLTLEMMNRTQFFFFFWSIATLLLIFTLMQVAGLTVLVQEGNKIMLYELRKGPFPKSKTAGAIMRRPKPSVHINLEILDA